VKSPRERRLAGYPMWTEVGVWWTLLPRRGLERNGVSNIAGSMAVERGGAPGAPILLEADHHGRRGVTPSDYMGEVNGDLSSRASRSRMNAARRTRTSSPPTSASEISVLYHPALDEPGPRDLHMQFSHYQEVPRRKPKNRGRKERLRTWQSQV